MKRLKALFLFLLIFIFVTPAFATIELKYGTGVTVRVGPFVDVGDGFTPQTDIAIGSVDEAELIGGVTVGAVTDLSSNAWAAIGTADGWYDLGLTVTDTGQLGPLTVIIQDDSDCLPVFVQFAVVTANYWDSKYGTDEFDVNVVEVGGTAQTANDNGADINDILTDTGTTLDDLVDDLESRLTATRAGYLDNLNSGVTTTLLGANVITTASINDGAITDADVANDVQVDVVTIETVDATDQLDSHAAAGASAADIWTYADRDLSGTTQLAANIVAYNLDHLMLTAVANNADMTTEVADGTVLSNLMSSGSDTSTYVVADDSLQGISEGAAGGGATAQEVWEYADRGLSGTTTFNDITAASVWSEGTRTLSALDEDDTTIDLDATTIGTVTTLTGHTAQSQDHATGVTVTLMGANVITTASINDGAITDADVANDVQVDVVTIETGDATDALDAATPTASIAADQSAVTIGWVNTLVGHTAQTADHTSNIADILTDTSTTLDDLVDDLESRLTATRAGYLDNLNSGVTVTTHDQSGSTIGYVLELGSDAQTDVNDQVLDVISTDTFTEPGKGAPTTTPTLEEMIHYLYKVWRNKVTTDASGVSVYDSSGTTVDQKNTHSDDGSTFSSGAMGSG